MKISDEHDAGTLIGTEFFRQVGELMLTENFSKFKHMYDLLSQDEDSIEYASFFDEIHRELDYMRSCNKLSRSDCDAIIGFFKNNLKTIRARFSIS